MSASNHGVFAGIILRAPSLICKPRSTEGMSYLYAAAMTGTGCPIITIVLYFGITPRHIELHKHPWQVGNCKPHLKFPA